MVKIVIAEKRKYDFVGREGDKITGFSYGGFLPDGEVITFTSRKEHPVTNGVLGYSEELAVDLDIRPKIWGGTVKYREAQQGE